MSIYSHCLFDLHSAGRIMVDDFVENKEVFARSLAGS